jgi:two-component system sensor histidine kinase YesM
MFGIKNSLQSKLAMAFSVVIAVIMLITISLYIENSKSLEANAYEKMEQEGAYFNDALNWDIQSILDLQIDFFNNRKLPFLAIPNMEKNAYEEREDALSVQERILTIVDSSKFVSKGILYIPGTDYYISDSEIRRMNADDVNNMLNYLSVDSSGLQHDGQDFYSVRTGQKGNLYTEDAQFVFVLFFSTEKIRNYLNDTYDGEKGSFIYNSQRNVLISDDNSSEIGKEILGRFNVDNNKLDSLEKQKIIIAGEKYFVTVSSPGELGVYVQYIKESVVKKSLRTMLIYYVFFFIALIVMSVLFIAYIHKIVHKPIMVLMDAFNEMKKGNLDSRIHHSSKDEFSYIYEAFNDTEDKLNKLIDEVYVQKNLAQKAQMKQLQAQINPHFLYNSFFILSRRIKREDIEGAEKLSIHLSNYFKYLTRDGADYILLYQEVVHARSYVAIQQERFSGRFTAEFAELPNEQGKRLVPRLILQPILENAFEHGLEDKAENALLKVSFAYVENTFAIIVEDNGEAVTQASLNRLNEQLNNNETKEVTGLINIHRRLKIYFGEDYGIRVKRSSLGGLKVMLVIPKEIDYGAESINS